MAQELHFTSAPRGIKPGSQGFCTVAATAGMPAALMDALERLSVYRPAFPPGDPRFRQSPPAWSHRLLSMGGRPFHLVSRLGSAPPDYTGRTNYYAHHLVLGDGELPPGGPARLLRLPGIMAAAWQGKPRVMPAQRAIPMDLPGSASASVWQALTGDANWGWAFADACLEAARRPVYLLAACGQDLLALIDESLQLLPPDRRWQVEFTTYATTLDTPFSCSGILAEAPQSVELIRRRPGIVMDLTKPLGAAPARTVQTPASATRPVVPTAGPAADISLPPEAPATPMQLPPAPAQPPPRLPPPPRMRQPAASRPAPAAAPAATPWVEKIAVALALAVVGLCVWLAQMHGEQTQMKAIQESAQQKSSLEISVLRSDIDKLAEDEAKKRKEAIERLEADLKNRIASLEDELSGRLSKQEKEIEKIKEQLPPLPAEKPKDEGGGSSTPQENAGQPAPREGHVEEMKLNL